MNIHERRELKNLVVSYSKAAGIQGLWECSAPFAVVTSEPSLN
jgi:hypothetical protein